MSYAILTSPIGNLCITCSPDGVNAIEHMPHGEPLCAKPGTLAAKVEAQLFEYFAGKRKTFDLPLAAQGTPFQQKVWRALTLIPFGQTMSYAEIAKKIKTQSPRAVGGACGANPLLIVVPCHRVIAAGGELGGFSAGLENKEWLLQFESGIGL